MLMRSRSFLPSFSRLFPALLLLFALSLPSCQDDPIFPEGENGDEESPKSRVFITAIQLNDYPSLDPSGNTWDPLDTSYDVNGDPDITFTLSEPGTGGNAIWTQASHFSNIPPATPVAYYFTEPLQIQPVGINLNVDIHDYELPGTVPMGSVEFFIGESPVTPKYPTQLDATVNGYSVSIGLRWEE